MDEKSTPFLRFSEQKPTLFFYFNLHFLENMIYCKKECLLGGLAMFTNVKSMGLIGLKSYIIDIEMDISTGLPRFDIVGLPDASVSESRDRVRSAIKNSEFRYTDRRITVNLAPADIKKVGPVYDLPIAVAMLMATRQIDCEADDMAFIGELSLDGHIRKVNGALPMVICAKENGIKEVFVPLENAAEASVVKGITVYAANELKEVTAHLTGSKPLKPCKSEDYADSIDDTPYLDFSDVKGQFLVKRALEIAAAGGHNTLMIGPPGSGKSMLAKRIPSILPDMTFEESLETTNIYSIAGALPTGTSLITKRPFRSPHHTVSTAGLSGGGHIPHPGEFSLAHNGVLFLDELPEFPRPAMEAMRQPIEDGTITISRVSGSLTYPCEIMLVCAMNPCPCGYFGHPTKKCTCPQGAPAKYLSKVSGPLLDRLDIHVEVPQVEFKKLSDDEKGESSAEIRKRVNAARLIQQKRFEGTGVKCNAKMTPAMTREFCVLDEDEKKFLEESFEKLGLSARAYDKILRISRTIADLDASEKIEMYHLQEAVQYRSLDRKFWR